MATTINSLRFTAGFSFDVKDVTAWGDLAMQSSDAPSSESSFAQGTGAGQVDKLYVYRGTLAASASDTLDLSGSLTDPVENACVFVKVKGVYVRQVATDGYTSTGITVAATVTNSAAAWNIPLKRGGVFLLFDPSATGLFTVTAGTGDLFKITNADGANGADYFVAICGTSA